VRELSDFLLKFVNGCDKILVFIGRRCEKLEILKIVLMIIFAIDCIALTVLVLMQEGKSAGLGTISGMADTYWGQNKGRSMEGALVKITRVLAILFIVLAAVLNLKVFA
jgi:preprotein translocase subunit SecG